MQVIRMKSPNTEGAEYGHLFSPNEASTTGTRLYPIELLAKRVPWRSTNNSSCCWEKRLFSLKLTAKSPLLRTTPTHLIEHEELVKTYKEPKNHQSLCSSIFGTGIFSAGYQKGSININPAAKPFNSNQSCLQIMFGQW